MKQHRNARRPARKLTLKRETLRRLDARELTAVQGATTTLCRYITIVKCDPNPFTTQFCPPQPTE